MAPTLLLSAFLIALALMIVTVFCGVVVIRILISSLSIVKKKSPDLYFEILGDRDHSWVERRAGSFKDASIVWALASRLYRGGQISQIVGETTCKRFAQCIVISLTAFGGAILIGGVVLIVGFVLAASH